MCYKFLMQISYYILFYIFRFVIPKHTLTISLEFTQLCNNGDSIGVPELYTTFHNITWRWVTNYNQNKLSYSIEDKLEKYSWKLHLL